MATLSAAYDGVWQAENRWVAARVQAATIAVTMMESPSATGGTPPVGPTPLFTAADRQLLHDCLSGHSAAWDDFVGRFGGLLAFVVDRTSAQRQIALMSADRDDLLADILLEILHRDAAVLRGFAGRSSLATYLAVVARRVVVRGLMQLSAKKRGHNSFVAGHEAVRGTDDHTRLIDREQLEVMLGRLDAQEARLIRLHHLESRSYGEISQITGMPLGSIGPALARARQKMKSQSDQESSDSPSNRADQH